MKKRGYIFTNKKHPGISIMSTVLGGISFIAILFGIISSFYLDGQIPARYGVAGAIASIYSIVGMVLAIYGFKKADSFRLFSAIGAILNGVCLAMEVFLLWIAG